MVTKMRKKIHITLDIDLLNKLDFLSTQLYISKGHILDNLIAYSLKKELKPISRNIERKKITTTVNPLLWENYKNYADLHNYKYNTLLETAFYKQYRNYIRKIKSSKGSHLH